MTSHLKIYLYLYMIKMLFNKFVNLHSYLKKFLNIQIIESAFRFDENNKNMYIYINIWIHIYVVVKLCNEEEM